MSEPNHRGRVRALGIVLAALMGTIIVAIGPARPGDAPTAPAGSPGSKPAGVAPEAPQAGPADERTAAPPGPGSGIVRPPNVSPVPVAPKPWEIPASPVPANPEPEAILLVSGHSAGWITMCGCPNGRAGGIARRAGYGPLLQRTFPGVPVRYLDLGGVVALGAESSRLTTDALLQGMTRIGYEAMNASSQDLGFSLEQYDYVQSHLKIPRFSANLAFHDNGELAFPPYRILSMPRPGLPDDPPLRVGLLGLVSDRVPLFAFGSQGRSLVARPMDAAIAKYLPELRAKSDLVVVLAEAPPDPFYTLLKKYKGIDLVVCGESAEVLINPILVDGTPVTAVGSQGKYMAELRIYRKDGKPAVMIFVHWLDARFPEEPALAKEIERTIDEINEASRRDVFQDSAEPPSTAPWVGADRCAECHPREFDLWKVSGHARALDSLAKVKRDYTITCVMCHVTGMYSTLGGGFINPRATPQLSNVQCEQCHGPAEAHLQATSAEYGKVARDLCETCHNAEWDPSYDHDTRWRTIAH